MFQFHFSFVFLLFSNFFFLVFVQFYSLLLGKASRLIVRMHDAILRQFTASINQLINQWPVSIRGQLLENQHNALFIY